MEKEILRKLGLTENEIKVYKALIELKSGSALEISKRAKIHRSKAYDSIERLIIKGIIHYTVKDFKKIFEVNEPQTLLKLLEEKEKQVAEDKKELIKLVDSYKEILGKKSKKQTSNVYEGLAGIKVFHNQMLRLAGKEDEIKVLGIPVIANELLEAYFLDFHKQRIRKNIPTKLLYSYEAREKVIHRTKLKATKAKYLSKEVKAPAVVWLCKDTVGLFSFDPTPICYEIKDPEVASGFNSYFDFLWKTAKS